MAHVKERITVSLQKDTAKFLKSYCAEKHVASVSAGVESIIAALKRHHDLQEMSENVTAYYNSLSEAERREEAAWGEFAENELARSELPCPTK